MRPSSQKLARGLAFLLLLGGASFPAAAQEYQLFERVAVSLEFAETGFDTTVRLDSNNFDLGTEINFENDLRLGDNKSIPAITVTYRPFKRHQFSFGYFDADRRSQATVMAEIRFGDLVIPVQATASLDWKNQDARLGYSYWPIMKKRTAFGVGGGLRVQELKATLTVIEANVFEVAEATGPLPYVWVEVRHGLTPKTRLTAGVGVLALEIGDYDGQQVILDIGIQHQTFKHFAFGGRFDLATVDVDTTAKRYTGSLDQDISSLRVFAKARFGKTDFNPHH